MCTLKGVPQDAANRLVAVGHFNFSELVVLRAAVAPVRCVLEDAFERAHGFTTCRLWSHLQVASPSLFWNRECWLGALQRAYRGSRSWDQPGPVLEGHSRRTLVVDYAVASASPRTGLL